MGRPRGASGGALSCQPLGARDLRGLPQLPACEILGLTGVERPEGIEAMPGLRNLTLTGKVRSFEPLTALSKLTEFAHVGDEPLDVEPLEQQGGTDRSCGIRCATKRAAHPA